MTNKDFMKLMSEKLGVNFNTSTEIINIMFSAISEKLSEGENIHITNFGKFDTLLIKEKKGYNPKLLKPIIIKSMKRTKFIPSSHLKKLINK